MSHSYVLDTSAFVALLYEEPGAEQVRKILANRSTAAISVAAVSLIELYYLAHRKKGPEAALQHFLWLRQLPIEIHSDLSERWLLEAGRIKASYPMSLADAQIAALASLLDATLVHKDPEYRALGSTIKQEELPFKAKQA